MSIGEMSLTVHVPRLGVTSRIYLHKIPDIALTFNRTERTIDLQATSTITHHELTSATIAFLTKLVVRCVVADKVGSIEISLEVVRPK